LEEAEAKIDPQHYRNMSTLLGVVTVGVSTVTSIGVLRAEALAGANAPSPKAPPTAGPLPKPTPPPIGQNSVIRAGATAPKAPAPLPRMSDRAIAQMHLNDVNAANVINEVPRLQLENPATWRRELGNLNQRGLAQSLENNAATKGMYLGINQPPGRSVPDLL